MTDTFTMGDAAYASGFDGTDFQAAAGYYGGPNAYHIWPASDWSGFTRKLPIWVAGYDGVGEGKAAVKALRNLGVPTGCFTVVDMEERVDDHYVSNFGRELQTEGYRVWVYGSANTVFRNPSLNGYWVADYAGIGPFMYNGLRVRATQYASGPNVDYSLVKAWTADGFWQ